MKLAFGKMFTFITIMALTFFLLNVIADNPYFHGLTRAIINEKVSPSLNLEIKYQSLGLRVVPLSITMYGLEVKTRTADSRVLVSASTLEAKVSLWSLLMGTPRLALIRANEFKISYPLPVPLTELFTGNAEAESQRKADVFKWPPEYLLPIDRLVVINSSVDAKLSAEETGKPDPLMLIIRGLNLDFQFSDWDKMTVEVDILSLDLYSYEQSVLAQAHLAIAGKMQGNKFRSEYLQIESGQISADGSLVLDVETKPETATSFREKITAKKFATSILNEIKISTKLQLKKADFSMLGKFLEIENTHGEAVGDVEVNVRFPIAAHEDVDWSAAGKVSLKDTVLDGFSLLDSKAQYQLNNDRLLLSNIVIKQGDFIYGGGRGEIKFNDELDFNFTAEADELPLRLLLEALQVPDFDTIDAAIISKDINVRGKGVPFLLQVDGNAYFTNLNMPILGSNVKNSLPGPSCHLALDLTANEDKLVFGNNSGHCFQLDNADLEKLRKKSHLAGDQIPTQSDLLITGEANFNNQKGISLKVASKALNGQLLDHFTRLSTEGKFIVDTLVEGAYDDIRVLAHLRGEKVKLGDSLLNTLVGEVEINAKQNILVLKNINITPTDSSYINLPFASLTLDDKLSVKAEVSVSNMSGETLAGFLKTIDPNLNLEFAIPYLDADFEGPLLYPLAYLGKFDFDIEAMTINHNRIFDRVKARLRSEVLGWHSIGINIELGDLKARADLSHKRRKTFHEKLAQQSTHPLEKLGISLDDFFMFEVATIQEPFTTLRSTADNDDPDHLQGLPYIGHLLKDNGIKAAVVFESKVEGDLRNLQGSFSGAFDRPSIFGSPIAPFVFSGFIDGSKIDIPILTHSGKAMVGRLTFDYLEDGIPYEWYFSFNRFDLRPIFSSFFYSDPRNYAYLSANWRMKGKAAKFWHSRGEFHIDDFRLRLMENVNDSGEKVNIDLVKGVSVLMTDAGWVMQGNESLVLKGEDAELVIDLQGNHPPDNLRIGLYGLLKVDPMKRLLPFIETAKGQLEIKGAISGNVTRPEIVVNIKDKRADALSMAEWDPLSIGFIDIPPLFRDIKLDVTYRNGQIEVHQLVALKGKDGRINVSGMFDPGATDAKPSMIAIHLDRIETNRIPISILESVDTTLSGDLSLVGNSFPLKLSGNITVDRATSIGNFDIRDRILDSIRRRKFTAPAGPEKGLFDLAIQIQANNSIRIRNRNLVALLGMDLYTTGSEKAPLFSGNIRIPEGEFKYKRNFKIERGLIIFDEPVSPPDPKLDIVGETRVSNYKVNININGYASDPKVSIATDPPNRADGTPITKMDILLLLSSGKLPDNDRGIGFSQAATAEAANLVIGQFEEPIEKLFDLSGQTVVRQVYLDTVPSTNKDREIVPRLNLPIRFTDDISFILQMDNNSNMTISSEYSLHESISISGSLDKQSENSRRDGAEETDTGIDLNFRFSFP